MIVRLKEESFIWFNICCACFNSMIVRLKADRRCILMFQPEFQFYDSPIKRARSKRAASYSRRCFNSMIVRLKAFIFFDFTTLRIFCFNSMIVRLKAYVNTCTVNAGSSFNSMIVRLKDTRKQCYPILYRRFNSMIVRLKALQRACGGSGLKLFQFYDSPIKRI